MNECVPVKIKGPTVPQYQSLDAAGCDLVANEDREIPPNDWIIVSTGLHLEMPPGVEGQVRSRSGLAAKHGIFVVNSPGTIDPDYRGEVKVILGNMNQTPFFVKKGDRIAQLVFSPFFRAVFEGSEVLSETTRGSGGLGSTGT